jgi:group I intron endonuclease
MEKVKTTFIYTISHPITEEIRYIGKANNIYKRIYKHIYDVNKTTSHKNNWIKSLLKEDLRPVIKILDEVPIGEWESWEIYWIEQFKHWGFNLTNISLGGRGPNGHKHTKKTKNRMGKSRIGIPLSDEHKEKISTQGKKHHVENPSYNMKGKNERTYIDRDLLYDLYITQDLSIPQVSNELDLSEKKVFENLHFYDIKKEEGWWLKGLSDKYKKVVLQYDLKGNLIKEWDGIVDISEELGFNGGNVANCCRGGVKTANDFIWRYKDEWFELDIDNLGRKKSRSHLSVIQSTLGGILIEEYDSIRIAASSNSFRSDGILKCCDNKSKSYKGFSWEFN